MKDRTLKRLAGAFLFMFLSASSTGVWAQDAAAGEDGAAAEAQETAVAVEETAVAVEETAVAVDGETSADAGEAGETTGSQETRPTVYHLPASNLPAGRSARLKAWIAADWKLDDVTVGIRPVGSSSDYTEIAMKRSDTEGNFVAVAPAELIQPPGVEYYIRAEKDGSAEEAFATPEKPHPVVVLGETKESRMLERLSRHDGARSEFRLDASFTSFGSRSVSQASGATTEHLTDIYGDAELAYRYRTLSFLYDFSFGLGVLRGNHPTFTRDGETIETGGGEDPGLNYGFGEATLELHRNLSVEPKLILGASETGFAAGAGALVRIGRIEGTRLEVGGEFVQDIGAIGFLRFAWDTVQDVPMGLTIEWTDRPSDTSAGVRLIYEAGYAFDGGFTLLGRVGYATRTTGVEPGFVSGLGLRYGF